MRLVYLLPFGKLGYRQDRLDFFLKIFVVIGHVSEQFCLSQRITSVLDGVAAGLSSTDNTRITFVVPGCKQSEVLKPRKVPPLCSSGEYQNHVDSSQKAVSFDLWRIDRQR